LLLSILAEEVKILHTLTTHFAK